MLYNQTEWHSSMWHSWRQSHCRLYQRQFHVSQPFLKRQPSVGCGGSIAWFRERLCGNHITAKSRRRSRVFAKGGARGTVAGRARQTGKGEKTSKKMELAGLDEEILFAGVAKIGTMANAFERQVKNNPQEYCVLQPCVTYQNVANGGPPFQIDGRVLTKWLQCTRTQCPVILRHVLNFFQSWVCFDPNRSQPVSKE